MISAAGLLFGHVRGFVSNRHDIGYRWPALYPQQYAVKTMWGVTPLKSTIPSGVELPLIVQVVDEAGVSIGVVRLRISSFGGAFQRDEERRVLSLRNLTSFRDILAVPSKESM